MRRSTPSESVLGAIGVMSAWSAQPEGPPELLTDFLERQLTGSPAEAHLAAIELIMGMTTLCGAVLLINEEATGIDVLATLRELALHYALA